MRLTDGPGGGAARRSDGAARRFDSHLAFALWLEAHRTAKFRKGGNVRLGHMALAYGAEEPNIWNPTGSFDRARHDRLRAARNKAFASLFTGPRDDAQQPPTVARPNYLAGESDTSLPGDRRRSYSFTELLTASRDAEKEIAA